MRRYCFPRAPVLLAKVGPAGAGNGAKCTDLRIPVGTLRGASLLGRGVGVGGAAGTIVSFLATRVCGLMATLRGGSGDGAGVVAVSSTVGKTADGRARDVRMVVSCSNAS